MPIYRIPFFGPVFFINVYYLLVYLSLIISIFCWDSILACHSQIALINIK